MKPLFSISLLLIVWINGLAQQTVSLNKVELSGYFENRFFPQEVNGDVILQDYNKLRLNLSSQVSEKIAFNGNINYQSFHGKTSFNMLHFIPQPVVNDYLKATGLSAEDAEAFFTTNQKDDILLDNAYLSIYTKNLNIRVGKQQLPWGSGYAWNPTDIFNVKNLLDPTYEKVGVNAFTAQLPFLNEGMVTAVLSVEDEWKTSTKALKAKYYALGFDVSVTYAKKEQGQYNYYTFTPFTQTREMAGLDLSGSIASVGIWAEAAYNYVDKRSDYGQYLVGADYTFMSGLYFMLEYYRNELGESSEKEYDFNHWMSFLGTDAENLGKDNLYFTQKYPIGELTDWSNYVIINLNDGSGMLLPWFDFNLNDNTELDLVGYIPFGKKTTEYGEFGKGGFARIRIYF